MPHANSSRVQQYLVRLPAAVAVNSVSPATPERNLLTVQNTGANPALLRFEYPVTQDGSDLVLLPGDAPLLFDTVVPVQSLNFLSVLGTTIAVVEGLKLPQGS